MRLLTRLLLSHTLPILVMGVALGVLLVSVVRMTVMLGDVRERELGALQTWQELHRAAWNIEVAMRHGLGSCESGAEPRTIDEALTIKQAALSARLAEAPGADKEALAISARGYVELAESVLAAENVCTSLASPENQKRRWQLDEALTDAWVVRMSELHDAVAKKDDEARRVGAAALSVGLASAVAALLLGLLVAQRLSKLLTVPLNTLERVAHRVGEGDFSANAPVEGPFEVQRLAEELDRMRARLAELDQLKQGFLASVSHELRTPLSKLREALSLLAQGAAGPISEKQARLVQIARLACEREIRIVTTLLDLSRLRAGAPLKLQARASIDDAIRVAIGDEAQDASELGVTLEVSIDGDAPRTDLDLPLVERAVANLVRNAIGVSKQGQTVRVRRTLEPRFGERAGPFAVVTVQDEGPGVPPEIRETVFNAFVTQAVIDSPKGVGVGLGLSLAREVAMAHGGELELLEVERQGATFRMWIDLSRPIVRPAEGARDEA